MTEEEKKAIEYFKSNLEMTKEMGKKWGFQEEIKNNEIILNLIQKQDTEINKLNRALDEMANTLDLNFSLSIKNYKFGKKEDIKEYFMKEDK